MASRSRGGPVGHRDVDNAILAHRVSAENSVRGLSLEHSAVFGELNVQRVKAVLPRRVRLFVLPRRVRLCGFTRAREYQIKPNLASTRAGSARAER
jgi:hypothetical protein